MKAKHRRLPIPLANDTFVHPSWNNRLRVEDDRTGMTLDAFRRAFADHLYYMQGVDATIASPFDYYMALAYTVRDRLMRRWIRTENAYYEAEKQKAVFYLSAEFLIGRQLGKNLLNTGCWELAEQTLELAGLSLDEILEQEPEPGLGNGGLGRLAACFLDSLATLDIPAVGYGIRYEFGIFQQCFREGWQVERPDRWLLLGCPWEFPRPEYTVEVKFGGHTENYELHGKTRTRWIPERKVLGVPHDILIPGYKTNTVNTLCLWAARATEDFDFEVFNSGDYTRAVSEKTFSENISKVLYPNDNTPQGRELRLRQEYFFVSCSLQDIIRTHTWKYNSLDGFPEHAAIQLNDTHPAIAVAELMRLFVDELGLEWEQAWDFTQRSLAYTNHTLLSEALEKWPVSMFQRNLPRHLQIIYEINHRFLEQIQVRFPGDVDRISRMSLIEEAEEKQIRMGNLAVVGSHTVNGVAKLHSELVKQDLFNDFYRLDPAKFQNKTNGITPRRWILLCNPRLSALITEAVGEGWARELDRLKELEKYVNDSEFLKRWDAIKQENKEALAGYLHRQNRVDVNLGSIFDVQVKRIHEYKRQLLFALYIVALYNRLKRNPYLDIVPRTFILGGKAAPGYLTAKLIIKLVNSIAHVVNNDSSLAGKMKVVFLENFCVSVGEKVYPAAELSEQISTAGMEASGTGNMKFALNGALTIGTLDGANIEIRDSVGPENFFLFGNTVDQLRELRGRGYSPRFYYESNHELRGVIDTIASGTFSSGNRDLFRPLVDSLLNDDRYMHCADFQSYVDSQERVNETYRDRTKWTKMSILNTANMAYFSSDRTIRDYCQDIWKVEPLKVELSTYDPDEAVLSGRAKTSKSAEKKKKAAAPAS